MKNLSDYLTRIKLPEPNILNTTPISSYFYHQDIVTLWQRSFGCINYLMVVIPDVIITC